MCCGNQLSLVLSMLYSDKFAISGSPPICWLVDYDPTRALLTSHANAFCFLQRKNVFSYLLLFFLETRSYAALRAADLDWIAGPGYSLGRVYSGEKPWNNFGRGRGGRAGISKNVTSAGSQLTWEGGQGRNKQKRYIRWVKTDLGGGAGQE